MEIDQVLEPGEARDYAKQLKAYLEQIRVLEEKIEHFRQGHFGQWSEVEHLGMMNAITALTHARKHLKETATQIAFKAI